MFINQYQLSSPVYRPSIVSIHHFSILLPSFANAEVQTVKCFPNNLTRCVKSVQTRSFFWSVFFCIQSEYRTILTRKNSAFGHFRLSDIYSYSGREYTASSYTASPREWPKTYIYHPCSLRPGINYKSLMVNILQVWFELGILGGVGYSAVAPINDDNYITEANIIFFLSKTPFPMSSLFQFHIHLLKTQGRNALAER